jgi:AcrR family transcriptional regulator
MMEKGRGRRTRREQGSCGRGRGDGRSKIGAPDRRRCWISYTEGPSVFQEAERPNIADGYSNRRHRPEAARRRAAQSRAPAGSRASGLSAGGREASLEAIARQAGVGIGTLYRHFPTREALFEAVYRREVDHLAELAEQLRAEAAPTEALRRWLRSNVEFIATKKGMSAALALAANRSSELAAYSFDRLTQAAGMLLERAVAAGEIRSDIGPEDLLRTLVGICYMHDRPGWQSGVLRLVDVFVDGLRARPEGHG